MLEGGKRIAGTYILQGSKKTPIVSVITIVWNCAPHIENTMLSIINQKYNNIEYIVIDGASTDGTLEIIQKYDAQISYWLSAPDEGLYDAMNKGIQAATGDYIWFINCGDMIYADDTTMNAIAGSNDADIIYGETMYVNSQYEELGTRSKLTTQQLPAELSVASLRYGMAVCHQSIIVKKEICIPYRTQYKINADYDWEISAVKKAKTMYNTNIILSTFLQGGISTKQYNRGMRERWAVMCFHYGVLQTLWAHIYIVWRAIRHKALNI